MKKRIQHLGSALIFIAFLIMAFGSEDDKQDSLNSDGTPKSERQIELEKQFSAWDGSHPGLTKMIKEAMNDPDSYEHAETKYWDMDDHLIVLTTYRGKNAFGGVVKNYVKAKVDLNGNVLEIIEEGP
ncbi:hypothetical protein [Flavobacterium sp. UBA7680]|uniref:hypothetical protein n=1 Tax=Flavobacterium sp. UBA7680 TaxID=1946559 RepID=UPI0025C3759B|nr:hypothetical protein [Flavobacterium sp. UBA7680]